MTETEETPITFKEFSFRYKWPTQSGIRSFRHRTKELGIQSAFVELGGRVMIYPERLFKLLEEKGIKKKEIRARDKTSLSWRSK